MIMYPTVERALGLDLPMLVVAGTRDPLELGSAAKPPTPLQSERRRPREQDGLRSNWAGQLHH